jgi:DNA polymerase-3 subunit beta
MKVSARASSLDAALTLAMMATRRGKVAPVIHVIAAGDAVSLTCSAPGISVRVSADAKVDIPGSVTVSDRLAALVSGFDQKADINISAEDGVATISCGRGRYRLPVLPGPLSIVRGLSGETASVEVSGQDLLALLEVLPAAGSEATRFYLTGVYLHNVDDRLISVCTDGIKLLRASVVAGMLSTDEHLIVPAKVAHALARLVEQTKAHVVTLRRSNSMFCVTASGFELVTSLIDATYPAYQRVIPPASGNNAHCVRSELHEALLRLEAVAAGTEAPLVALSWADGGPLQLFLPRQPLDAADAINAEAHGSAQVALSLSQLRTMVANFDDDRLHIESADADTPITIRGEHDRLGVLFSCRWNSETEKRPASARSSAKPTATADQRTENRG